MGCCFSRLDSIEHCNTLTDVETIITNDRNLTQTQLQIVVRDNSLNDKVRQKKVLYLQKIIRKLNDYLDHIKRLEERVPPITQLEICEIKINYKTLMMQIDTQNYNNIDEVLQDFDNRSALSASVVHD